MPTKHVPGGTTSTSASNGSAAPARDDVDEAQVLVEDVSIDGMCGVY